MPDAPDPDYDPNSATIPLSGPRPTLSGSNVDLPLPEELAKLLPAGAYEISGFLGAGGMGAVYKGMQIRLKRPVAIKIMRRDMGKDHDFEARFEREAQAMAKLNHPNIISVIDFGEAGPDYLFIVMELVDGTDLMDVIRSKQMTQEMALTLLPQICDALQFAHDHGIVHRDIKPSNIMLTRDGRVKMADFGLAKHFDHAESGFRTQTGTGMGTPDYAAPEQFDPTTPVDHRADIYALGVMIYQMITGALPRGVWRPPSQRAPVSTQWDAVVSRAMQNDPSERYQKASEVKTELSSIPLAGSKTDTPVRLSSDSGAAAKPKEAERSLRSPLLFGLIAAAAVVALGIFLTLRKPAPKETPSSSVAVSPSSGLPIDKSSSTALEKWQDVLRDPAKAILSGAVERTPEGLRFTGTGSAKVLRSKDEQRDGATRMRAVLGGLPLKLVVRSGPSGLYQLTVYHEKEIGLGRYDEATKQLTDLRNFKLSVPLRPGQPYELELRVVGQMLTAKLDGVVLGTVTDANIAQGKFGISATGTGAPVLATTFDFLDLENPVSTTPNLPVTKPPITLPALPESAWKPLFTEAEWRASNDDCEFVEGLLHIKQRKFHPKTQPTADGAIRARIIYREGTRNAFVVARGTEADGQYVLGLGTDAKHVFLGYFKSLSSEGNILARHFLPRPLASGDGLSLELILEGDHLIGLLNGAPVIDAHDTHLKEPGRWGIYASPTGWFESVEVQSLPAATAGPWQDVLRDPKKLSLAPLVAWTPEGLRFTGIAGASLGTGQGPQRDAAVRMRTAFGAVRPRLTARQNKAGDKYMLSAADATRVTLYCWDQAAKKSALKREFSLRVPLQPGQDYELELRVVGQTFTAKCNGENLGTVNDGTIAEGAFGVLVGDGGGAPVLVKSLEVLDLDKPVSASPNLPVSKSSDPKFPPGQWVKLFTKPEDLPADLRKPDSGVTWEDGWLRCAVGKPRRLYVVESLSNYAIRATMLLQGTEYQNKALIIRATPPPSDAGYRLALTDTFYARRAEDGSPSDVFLWNVPVPVVHRPRIGEEYTLEWGCVGDKLIGRLGKDFVKVVADTTMSSGQGFFTGGEPIRDIEVINLDGLPKAEALRLLGVDEKGNDLRGKTSTSTSAVPWQDALKDRAFTQSNGNCVIGPDGFQSRIDYIWHLRDGTPRDGAIRMVTAYEGPLSPKLIARADTGSKNHYQVNIEPGGSSISLVRKEDTAYFKVANAPITPAIRSGDQVDLELHAVGPELSVKLNGTAIVQATDTTLPTGEFGIWALAKTQAPVRSLQFLPLTDSTSQSPSLLVSSSPTSATQATPFINTLGMKFVPVPITGGPTDKQRVLFSVWETRVQDYEAYAKETKRERPKPDFEQGPGHPAVNVTWDEAVAFCAWLTDRERKAGKITPNEAYRLPSDHEWSCAAGLGEREDASKTPTEKDAVIADLFLWGSAWPPPAQAGNYWSEELTSPPTPIKMPSDVREPLVGRRDGFAATAPVGSFSATPSGLHDLGGNVLEWCADWMDAAKALRVLRGGSWASPSREHLLVSNRSRGIQNVRTTDLGFRCVLAPAP